MKRSSRILFYVKCPGFSGVILCILNMILSIWLLGKTIAKSFLFQLKQNHKICDLSLTIIEFCTQKLISANKHESNRHAGVQQIVS
jgi:hypothetical protein